MGLEQLDQYFWDHVEAAEGKPWKETADEVLVNPKQVRWTRYLHSLANAPDWMDLGVTFRIRPEILTNPFRKNQASIDQDEQVPVRTRARVGLDWRVFRFLFEFQDSRSFGVDENEFGGSAMVSKNDVQQLFGAITLKNVLHTGFRTDVHVGRINLDFGARRLIARNVYRNTTNAFDGVHWNLGRENSWRVRAFLVQPTTRTFGGVDRLFSAEDTLFWGVYHESEGIPWLKTNLYYYGINETPPDISEQRTHSTFGFRLYERPKEEWLDYGVESAWQVGTVAGKDHFAFFQHARLGYTFNAPWSPWLVFQYDYASGTENPSSDESGTFDGLFGARAFEYNPTGIFGPFFRSNISSPGVRLILRPDRWIRLMVKFRAWWLAQARDEWVGSGLQDPTGRSGNELGQDLELRVVWRPYSYVAFSVGYDHFFKGEFIENQAKIPGNPSADDSDYFFFSTLLRF